MISIGGGEARSLNEAIGYIAQRAGELAEMKMEALRLLHPDNLDGTKTGKQWVGVTKSRLIEEILVEEFCIEPDLELEG